MRTGQNDEHSSGRKDVAALPLVDDDWVCTKCGGSITRPVAISFKEFCRLTSLGRTTAWALARDKKIEIRRVGSRTVVLTRSIDGLLDLNSRGPRDERPS